MSWDCTALRLFLRVNCDYNLCHSRQTQKKRFTSANLFSELAFIGGLHCASLALAGKLRLQFMPSLANTKKPQFPAVIFQAGVCRGIALRFACPLGKLQMQFMPFPSNTKKPQFPAVIFQAGVPTGIVLAAWFCFTKSAPSRHSLRSALFANAKSHRLRLSLRATFGVEPQGVLIPLEYKKARKRSCLQAF